MEGKLLANNVIADFTSQVLSEVDGNQEYHNIPAQAAHEARPLRTVMRSVMSCGNTVELFPPVAYLRSQAGAQRAEGRGQLSMNLEARVRDQRGANGMTVISTSLAPLGLYLCRWEAIDRWDLVVLPLRPASSSALQPAGEWERRAS